MKKILVFLLSLGFFNIVYSQDDLNVIKGKWLEYSDAGNSLYHYLSDQAISLLKEREGKIASIATPEEWRERQDMIKKALLECTGPFPERTALNARVVRTVDKGSFRVEHVIFESLPGFYVTSSLFIPSGIKKNSKSPAIIYCSGHSADGYRSDVYQHVILNLVKKGFIVFAFDPVGQGERLEYFDARTGKSMVGGPTSEHSYPGAQALLAGKSEAYYMIWDGIRAVDYLLSRKEVDNSRIGITGRSGGGTQSAMIAAFDERIYAAAPENYITNYTRLLQTIGPQDAEQNLTGFIAKGLDHPDFLIVRAPKPALMITTTRDMFSIQGAIETEHEVSKVYAVFGKPGNFSRSEDDAAHESTKKNREKMYAFFREHLNNPGNSSDEEVPLLTKDELKVTETGQLSTTSGSETVFSLTLKSMEKSSAERTRAEVLSSAKRLSGYAEPSDNDKPFFTGRLRRNGYAIEKYFIKGEGKYVIPYLIFRPEKASGRAVLFLHPGGKDAVSKAGGYPEQLALKGFTVLVPDLIGTGETGPGDLKGDAYFKGASHNLWYASVLSGRSVAGIQAGDITKLALLLKQDEGATEVTGLAVKEASPALLHSAVLSDAISSLVLIEPYSSFRSVAATRLYNPVFIMSSVAMAIPEYDLPDLEAAFAPKKLVIAGTTDGDGDQSDSAAIQSSLQTVMRSYDRMNASENLRITDQIGNLPDDIASWLQ